MKVAIVIDQVGGGGGEVFIGKVRRQLEKEQEEVEILSGDEDLSTIRLPFSKRGSVFRLMDIFRAGRKLSEELKRTAPDLILILSPVAAIATMEFLPDELNAKTVYAPRYLALDHWEMIQGGVLGKINRKIESMALNFSYDRIFALSENMRRRIRGEGSDVPIDIVPIGVDTSEFSPKYVESQNPTFLFVGRFEPEKGYKLFIEASKETEGTDFVMVGDKKEKLGEIPSSLEVRGKVPHSEMPEVYNEATALVMPSYTEGLPRVCLESLSCGTPVIASEVGGVPDLVKEGETGYLVEPGDLNRIIERIEILKENPDIAEKMEENGRRHIEENYEEEETLERTVGEIRKVVEDLD